jgi:hypothetical protein
MIEKAVEAYDKLLVKRRETVHLEAKRQALRSAGEGMILEAQKTSVADVVNQSSVDGDKIA